MANLGEIVEIMNSDEITLEVGANNYILLDDLDIHIARTENRQPTTDGGVLYTYGKSDSWFTASFVSTGPELVNFNTLTETDSNGAMTSTAWLIKGLNVTGGSNNLITFSATGVLREFEAHKSPDGASSKVDIFVRIIGNTTTVALSTV
jgi:hypothetical protein